MMREKWLLPVALGLSLAAGGFFVYSYNQWRQPLTLPAAGRERITAGRGPALPEPAGEADLAMSISTLFPRQRGMERTDLRRSGWCSAALCWGRNPWPYGIGRDPNQSWLVREGRGDGEKILLIGRGWVEVLVNGVHTRRLETE